MAKSKPSKKKSRLPKKSADPIFEQFEINLCRAQLEADPKNARALEMLGQSLTRTQRHQEALEVDLKLSALRPRDPYVFYNLACSYSNLGNLDGAFEALRQAFAFGYRDYRHLLRDPDLENVRRDRRFKKLMDERWGKRQP